MRGVFMGTHPALPPGRVEPCFLYSILQLQVASSQWHGGKSASLFPRVTPAPSS